MKVLVIGATGLTGQIAVRRLLERGDEVTALARDPAAVTVKHDHLRAAKGAWGLTATYGSGHSDWVPWKTRIASDGTVEHQNLRDNPPRRRSSRLGPKEIAALEQAVTAADFMSLAPSYDHPGTDAPTLVLTLTHNGSTKEVVVYAPGDLKKDPAVRRFLLMWDELLRAVPSPNPGELPGLYKL